MSEDPPIGIDFDFDNLSKVDWDNHSDEAVEGFISHLENLDFEDGVDVSDTGYSGSYRKAANWVEDNVLSKRKKEGNEVDKITPKKDKKTPLGEFILSYFDRENGVFPKGETAILTMVEKDYGEQFINPAKAFIEAINAKFEEFHGYKDSELMDGADDDDYYGPNYEDELDDIILKITPSSKSPYRSKRKVDTKAPVIDPEDMFDEGAIKKESEVLKIEPTL